MVDPEAIALAYAATTCHAACKAQHRACNIAFCVQQQYQPDGCCQQCRNDIPLLSPLSSRSPPRPPPLLQRSPRSHTPLRPLSTPRFRPTTSLGTTRKLANEAMSQTTPPFANKSSKSLLPSSQLKLQLPSSSSALLVHTGDGSFLKSLLPKCKTPPLSPKSTMVAIQKKMVCNTQDSVSLITSFESLARSP